MREQRMGDSPPLFPLSSIKIENTTSSTMTIRLEPWGNEYNLAPGEAFNVVERGANPVGELEIHLEDGGLVFYGRVGSVLCVVVDGNEVP
jgi:hypothetical protein